MRSVQHAAAHDDRHGKASSQVEVDRRVRPGERPPTDFGCRRRLHVGRRPDRNPKSRSYRGSECDVFPARYRGGELDLVLSRDPDRGDTDGGKLTTTFHPGQKRPAGEDPPLQDCDTTVAGTRGQRLLGKATTIEVADGEGDLGAPKVHSQDHAAGPPPSRSGRRTLCHSERKVTYLQRTVQRSRVQS